MVASAAGIIGAHGVDAASFTAVLADSRAPRGSIYYYFPSGKRQLVEDAVRWTSALVLDHQRACSARTAAGVLAHFLEFFRRSVVSSRCRTGCPLAAVAIGSYSEEELLARVVRSSFQRWISLLARQLRARGVRAAAAQELAVTALASIEGALILCRAAGGVEPLDTVGRQLRRLATSSPRDRRAH